MRLCEGQKETNKSLLGKPSLNCKGDLFRKKDRQDQRIYEGYIVWGYQYTLSCFFPVFPPLYLYAEKKIQEKFNDHKPH